MNTQNQLELFRQRMWTSDEIARLISAQAPLPVAITFTRNQVSMISVRFSAREIRLRLHEAFLTAPEDVLAALRQYVCSRSRAAWNTVRTFAARITPDPVRDRPVRESLAGTVYDLHEIMDRVNRLHFNGKLNCRICWGKAAAPRRRRVRSRTIRYGSYVRSRNLVRINPLLDDQRVPAGFVEYIVFHELLHAVVPSELGKRWNHHHAGYRALERAYPNIAAMRKMAKSLVRTLTRQPQKNV